MDGKTAAFTDSVHELSDIELATLLCLITDQHCIVYADAGDHDNVARELDFIARKTFGLSCVSIDCSPDTSLEDFGRGVLTTQGDDQTGYFDVNREVNMT